MNVPVVPLLFAVAVVSASVQSALSAQPRNERHYHAEIYMRAGQCMSCIQYIRDFIKSIDTTKCSVRAIVSAGREIDAKRTIRSLSHCCPGVYMHDEEAGKIIKGNIDWCRIFRYKHVIAQGTIATIVKNKEIRRVMRK